jgi:hypothetical protein
MIELVMAPTKAETVSHCKGAVMGLLKSALLVTNPKYNGERMPTNVQVAVGRINLWYLYIE